MLSNFLQLVVIYENSQLVVKKITTSYPLLAKTGYYKIILAKNWKKNPI